MWLAQTRKFAPAVDERLLDRVLRAIGIAKAEIRDPEQAVEPGGHQSVEGVPIPVFRPLHQSDIGHGRWPLAYGRHSGDPY
jgi:hypothetical protein